MVDPVVILLVTSLSLQLFNLASDIVHHVKTIKFSKICSVRMKEDKEDKENIAENKNDTKI